MKALKLYVNYSFLSHMALDKTFEKKMSSDKDGIRFATPEPIAKHRASRLKCKTIADISCGIGGQTIYFAKTCEHVFAVEIDPVKIKHAKKNCRKHGVSNVTFICGDALSPEVLSQIPKVDVVFSDPARPAEEDVRKMDSLNPGIPEVMNAYKEKTGSFAFEAPPQMPPDRINFNCEKEYISLNGKLNRLTLYFGDLKKYDRIAVSLPSGNAIVSNPDSTKVPPLIMTDTVSYNAFEPDPAVVSADLLPELALDMFMGTGGYFKVFKPDNKRTLLTSELLMFHPLIKNNFIVLRTMPIGNDEEITDLSEYLQKIDAGKVVLRGSIDPKDYWTFRNRLEEGLSGKKTIHLFFKEKEAIICELMAFDKS